MPYTTDTEIRIDLNEEVTTTYVISSQHRATGNPDKTVWTINFNEEVACFTQSRRSEWIQDNYGWGFMLIDTSI